MKKGEIVVLNALLGKIKLPAMSGDELYEVLSAKSDIGKEAEAIEAKAEDFRKETKPEGVDEYNAKLSEPRVREWWDQYTAMRNRLMMEEHTGGIPQRCISKELLPKMVEGFSTEEAVIVMKHLLKEE